MPAGDRDGADRLRSQLIGKLPQLVLLEPPQIGGIMDRVEQLGFRCHGVGLILTNTGGVMVQFPNSRKGSGDVPKNGSAKA